MGEQHSCVHIYISTWRKMTQDIFCIQKNPMILLSWSCESVVVTADLSVWPNNLVWSSHCWTVTLPSALQMTRRQSKESEAFFSVTSHLSLPRLSLRNRERVGEPERLKEVKRNLQKSQILSGTERVNLHGQLGWNAAHLKQKSRMWIHLFFSMFKLLRSVEYLWKTSCYQNGSYIR